MDPERKYSEHWEQKEIGYLLWIKLLSKFLAGMLSTAVETLSIETLQPVAIDKGVDGLDALLLLQRRE